MRTYYILIITISLLNFESIAQSSISYCDLEINKMERGQMVLQTKLFPLIEFFPLPNTINSEYTIPNIDVSLTKFGKALFMNFSIKFQRGNLANYPGYIPEKEQMVIHFVTGGNIILINIAECIGYRSKEGDLIYNPRFFVPREQYYLIKENDIDYISFNWTNESQTYESYQVDVVRNLTTCVMR